MVVLVESSLAFRKYFAREEVVAVAAEMVGKTHHRWAEEENGSAGSGRLADSHLSADVVQKLWSQLAHDMNHPIWLDLRTSWLKEVLPLAPIVVAAVATVVVVTFEHHAW